MNRVFVVQNSHRLDRETGRLEPKYNVGAAQEYGKIEFLLRPTASPFNPEPVVQELKEKLIDFGDTDKLVLIGNPVLIGLAVAIAADANEGRVGLLQWNGKSKKYIPVSVENVFYQV